MLKVSDLIKVKTIVPPDHFTNLENLTGKVNHFFRDFVDTHEELIVTSGYRTMEDHLRIYKDKGITDPAKIPMKSNHLFGHAVDVIPNGVPVSVLQEYVVKNVLLAHELGLAFESFAFTKRWVHVQDVLPPSGNMFFIP